MTKKKKKQKTTEKFNRNSIMTNSRSRLIDFCGEDEYSSLTQLKSRRNGTRVIELMNNVSQIQ